MKPLDLSRTNYYSKENCSHGVTTNSPLLMKLILAVKLTMLSYWYPLKYFCLGYKGSFIFSTEYQIHLQIKLLSSEISECIFTIVNINNTMRTKLKHSQFKCILASGIPKPSIILASKLHVHYTVCDFLYQSGLLFSSKTAEVHALSFFEKGFKLVN